MSLSSGSRKRARSDRELAWIGRYTDLVRFLARAFRMPREVPNPRTPEELEESRLGGWVRYQRRRSVRGTLPTWQRDLLDNLDEFSWDPHGDQWDEWFRRLRLFLADEQRVPRYRTQDAGERALAAWVHKQRFLHRRGSLSSERVIALRELPFKIV